MTSYIDNYMADLKRQAAERQAKREAETAAAMVDDPLAVLKQKIIEWFNARPQEAHPEYYYMTDLQRLLRTPPQALGLALHELGWTRRRVWTRGSPFRQRWYPPEPHRNTAAQ